MIIVQWHHVDPMDPIQTSPERGKVKPDMRKSYNTPELRSEKLVVGVYGDYGDDGDDGGGVLGNFVGFFNPLFGLCCGGG